MLGDSFCKLRQRGIKPEDVEDFQSPCLGTLFARLLTPAGEVYDARAFNPHAWGLFLQDIAEITGNYITINLSIPMLGDSFCKLLLFLSKRKDAKTLSIPMLGDSFCKLKAEVIRSVEKVYFQSPCLGTLFASCPARRVCCWWLPNFQSPCLGTLFARRGHRVVLQA